eukprot:Skav216901  [mRNA]  locus=scaffold685:94495:96151:- [translate_table: standard]
MEGLTAMYYEGRQLETILKLGDGADGGGPSEWNHVHISGTLERIVFEHFDRSALTASGEGRGDGRGGGVPLAGKYGYAQHQGVISDKKP